MESLAYLETANPKELSVEQLRQAISLVEVNYKTALRDIQSFIAMYGDRANGEENDPLHAQHWFLIAEGQELKNHLNLLRYEFAYRCAIRDTRRKVSARDEGGAVVVFLEDYR